MGERWFEWDMGELLVEKRGERKDEGREVEVVNVREEMGVMF